MYKLVGLPMTRASRVIWCFEELGVEYEIDPAMPQSEAIRAVNPSGKVPALIDGDDVVIDSVAICQYLADKHGAMTFPAGSIERAHMDSWIHFANDDVESPLWVWFKHERILPEDQRVPNLLPTCAAEFERALNAMDMRLGDNQYVMGDTFTVPDIIIGHCANWAKSTGKFPLPEPGSKLDAYFKRLHSRPAYKRAAAKREAT